MTSSSRDSSGSELSKQLIAAARAEGPSEASLARVQAEIDGAGVAGASAGEPDLSLSELRPVSKPRLGVWAMAAAALSLAGVLGLLWMQKSDAPTAGTAQAPATVAPATPPTAEAVATAEPTALASAAATAAPSASSSASASFEIAVRGPRGTGRAPKATGSQAPGKAKPAAAKPGSKCGCAPADLMCNMRCAEKK